MAKEEIHNYLRTAIILATIVFAGGGYAMKVNGNSDDIREEQKERSESDKTIISTQAKLIEDIHSIQLNHKDTQALTAQSVQYMNKIDSRLEGIQTQMNNQATIQAVNSEKLKTLTDDSDKDTD